MGGREVGGLANMLAAHMNIEDPVHRHRVQQFWTSPTIATKPGLKAVDMFRAVADGRIKALWVMSTNPAVSMPDADGVAAAIRDCPFVVVSDVTAATDTAKVAHVVLPAAAWGEKSGTVTNSERRISRQRSFLRMPGDARPDWWIICEVARRMGWGEAFAYTDPAAIFAEHAALSAFENDDARDFDIGSCADIDADRYDDMLPFQWPSGAGRAPAQRVFSDGCFSMPDGRARFVAVEAPSRACGTAGFALTLNTGRLRDQWHTMTRTGKSARLSQHYAEPFVEIHPEDAARAHINDADLVRVSTGLGAILVRALVTPRQQIGSVFVPMHWSDENAARARRRAGRRCDGPDLGPARLKERARAHRAVRCCDVWFRGAEAAAGGLEQRVLGHRQMPWRLAGGTRLCHEPRRLARFRAHPRGRQRHRPLLRQTDRPNALCLLRERRAVRRCVPGA